MRTPKARRLRRGGLIKARIRGHRPRLIAHSGAICLYGCAEKCSALLEIWDAPSIVNGTMAETNCPGIKVSVVRRILISLVDLLTGTE